MSRRVPGPAALSMYDVLLEVLAAPPAAAAIESTSRISLAFGGVPCSSSRPPSWPTATIVPMVSKKSVIKSVKMNISTTSQPARPDASSTLNWPSSDRSGRSTTVFGSSGTFSDQPFGLG